MKKKLTTEVKASDRTFDKETERALAESTSEVGMLARITIKGKHDKEIRKRIAAWLREAAKSIVTEDYSEIKSFKLYR